MTSTIDQAEFDDIRPYHDGEVTAAMQRLIEEREMANTLLSMRYPRAPRWLRPMLRPLVRRAMHRRFDVVHSVRDLQELIGEHMRAMLDKTGTDFRVSGLDRLDRNTPYLFISNHRDIAMDPAFVNLALDNQGFDTVRIAIGDNLLSRPFISDLIRLNKSFIVKRSVSGRREKLKALTTLSRYIRFSLCEDRSNVWIAQREGRAKDGVDRTEKALIKMLALGRPKGQSFAEAIDDFHIVPVSIAYQFDPCDLDKARELHTRATSGAYQKSEREDLISIYKGIVGDKGRVDLVFGDVLPGGFETDEEVAAYLDRQIVGNYRLQATNLLAWELRHGSDPRVAAWKADMDCDWQAVEEALLARVAGEPDPVRDIFLDIYANPVQSRLDLIGE